MTKFLEKELSHLNKYEEAALFNLLLSLGYPGGNHNAYLEEEAASYQEEADSTYPPFHDYLLAAVRVYVVQGAKHCTKLSDLWKQDEIFRQYCAKYQ